MNEISSMGCGYRVERGLWLSREREEERGETRVISDLPCQIANLFPTLVLIIKLKLLLHIDSSGCALVLSPIKQEKWRDYMKPSGVFYGSCETVKPCHGLQSNKTSSLRLCVCVCDPASYVGSNASLSFKFDYFGEHFSISPTMFLRTEICRCASISMYGVVMAQWI